jgi:hypothetical protein
MTSKTPLTALVSTMLNAVENVHHRQHGEDDAAVRERSPRWM